MTDGRTKEQRDAEVRQLEHLAMMRLRKEFRMRDAGAGKYDALCPAHDDRNKSLRVYRVDDRLYFKCYAGCDFNDVRRVLGLPTFNNAGARRLPADRPRPQPKTKSTRYNFPALADRFAADGPTLAPLASALRVSVHALLDADVGRAFAAPMYVSARGEDMDVSAWTFPMVDAELNVIGLRLRALKANARGEVDKFSWTDSTPGLFAGRRWIGSGPILIVEGPTDRAAAYDWGYDAIGRPSCNDAGEMVAEFLRRIRKLGRRDVVILAQLDTAKPKVKGKPEAGVFYPGQDGAHALAEQLFPIVRGSLKILTPPQFAPGKVDARRWKNEGGATRNTVDRAIGARQVFYRRSA